MLQNMLKKVTEGEHLTEEEMVVCMQQIMNGTASDSQIASFLTALKLNGESIEEIVGGAKVMREKAEQVELQNYYTVDTCGTGGDQLGTYNISTAVAFVVAAAGVKVVKHGNRSVSSKCGSADVLEALGVNINLKASQVETCVKETNMGFFFAPMFHQAMKYVAKTRKELGFRTIFNILGPLANPANAKAQVLGVYDERLTEPMAKVLFHLGVEKALVVHGKEGLDEISISTETMVSELSGGEIKNYTLTPEQFGLQRGSIADILGGGAQENAGIIRNLLQGEKGAKRDIMLMNAGATLYVGKKVKTIELGIELARELIDSKKTIEKLEEFISCSQRVAKED